MPKGAGCEFDRPGGPFVDERGALRWRSIRGSRWAGNSKSAKAWVQATPTPSKAGTGPQSRRSVRTGSGKAGRYTGRKVGRRVSSTLAEKGGVRAIVQASPPPRTATGPAIDCRRRSPRRPAFTPGASIAARCRRTMRPIGCAAVGRSDHHPKFVVDQPQSRPPQLPGWGSA